MTPDFHLDLRLTAASEPLADLELCHVRLQSDARWPWLLLVPRRGGLVELTDLSEEDASLLFRELKAAAAAVRAVGAVFGHEVAKLNVGALGNIVRQLHVHVIGRREDDPAGPGPVWGVGETEPYTREDLDRAVAAAVAALRA